MMLPESVVIEDVFESAVDGPESMGPIGFFEGITSVMSDTAWCRMASLMHTFHAVPSSKSYIYAI